MTSKKFSSVSVSAILALSLGFLCIQLLDCSDAYIISSVSGSKILGGTPAADKAFPFQVYIEIPHPVDSDYVNACGGSIIKRSDNRYKILTAAHCFDAILENHKPTNKDILILVIMGANNIVTQRNRGKVLNIKYETVKVHALYDEDTNANDLAIIPFPDDFTPVPGLYDAIGLAASSDANSNYAETEVTFAGWGDTNSQGEDSDQLLFIQSKILADDACDQARVFAGVPAAYNSNFLCIDGTGDKGACHGDSGGPVIAGNPPVVVGISSYRLTPKCKGSTPSYFIRVVKYLQWITLTI